MIREFRISDKEDLFEAFESNIPKYFDSKEINDFKTYLAEYSSTYLTIECENKIVGGIGYLINEADKSAQITWMFLKPDYTDHGLGREAFEYCMSVLRTKSILQKLVITTSQLAYKFFEKFGLDLVKTDKNYWGEGLDLYLMEMTNLHE